MKMVSTLPEDVNMNENAILATREIRAGILSCNFDIEIKTGLSVKLVKVYINPLALIPAPPIFGAKKNSKLTPSRVPPGNTTIRFTYFQ